MNVSDFVGKKVAFLASGGLDSCTITRWLTDKGVQVVSFTANFAQPDEVSLDDVTTRMKSAGAVDALLIDARESLAEAGLKIIQSQAYYEGRYWNTTGIARYMTVQSILPVMKKQGISVISHGATGRGNDQVRFQLATHMLEPTFEVYAPWRDNTFLSQFKGRSEMIDYCQSKGLNIKATKDAPYSTDANFLGLTHEAGVLESIETPARFITPIMGHHPMQAPDKPEEVTIKFEKGRPTEVNGKKLSLLEVFLLANKLAGKHAVGIGTHVIENRFVGIKSRGVYESPGMELLGSSYEFLIQMIIDRRARDTFEMLSRNIAKQIYQGYWFDLSTQVSLKAIEHISNLVSGEITVSMYKGTISFVKAKDVEHSIYSEAESSMEAIGTYDHSDTEGLMKVLGVSARVLATSGQI